MKIFISHSSQNSELANKFCLAIEENGNECFIAPRDIRVGYEYAEEIINGIDSSDILLLILTKEANDSPHVLREVERCVSRKIPIVVYKVEELELNKSLEYFLMAQQWYNCEAANAETDVIECIKQMAEGYAKDDKLPEKKEDVKEARSNKGIIFAVVSITVAIVALTIVMAIIFRPKQSDNPNAPDEAESTSAVKLGDAITLGQYYVEPIQWRIIKLSEDGKQGVVITEKIISMKAFDAAESGKFNVYEGASYGNTPSEEIDGEIQKQIRGNNSWEESNIRRWLNAETRAIIYEDQIPSNEAMVEGKNGYNEEAGFLYNFTEEEREAILITPVTTGDKVTEDKVFLLSKDELKWLETANVSIYAAPTREAREYDDTDWFEMNITDYKAVDHYWWLRDAKEGTTCETCFVNPSCFNEMVDGDYAALEGFGIRPAMTVDLTKINIEK